jgi:hypothetical protein
MEFFIDLAGRSRKVKKENVALAVEQVGYIYVEVADQRDDARSNIDRTVIVSLRPRLPSKLAVAALGYKLADLKANRIVVAAGPDRAQCSIFTDDVLAMRSIAAAADGRESFTPFTSLVDHNT